MSFEKYLRKKQIKKEAIEAASKSVNDALNGSYLRSEFEKIEWVKERLNHVWWSQEKGYCDTGKHPRANASFLNGAWSMYQHQQSKTDDLQRRNQMLNDNIKEQCQKLVYQNEVIETQAEKLIGLRAEKEGLQNNINLLNEALDIKEQLNQKLREREDELQKKNTWLSGVAERENKRAKKLQEENINTTVLLGKTIQERNELQKQRDSFIKAYEIEMDNSYKLQKRLDAALEVVKQGIRKQGIGKQCGDYYLEKVEELLEGGGC